MISPAEAPDQSPWPVGGPTDDSETSIYYETHDIDGKPIIIIPTDYGNYSIYDTPQQNYL